MENISLQSDSFQCEHCGASLKYKPGTNFLHCDYCGADTPIDAQVVQQAEKLDFEEYAQNIENLVACATKVIACRKCGAESTFEENLKSVKCPYCNTPLIESDVHEERLIQPSHLLPFKLTDEEMRHHLGLWLKSLWFAPKKLKKRALLSTELQGVYIPCWVYDAQTVTAYTGQRGDTYTTTVGVGKNRRTVTQTRWRPVSGRVSLFFDNLLVTASRMVPIAVMDKIHNWDTGSLVEADNRFLSGFVTEKYVKNMIDGYKHAKQTMETQIDHAVRRDIGGSQQRIRSKNTQYNDVKFKLILLPVYISSYTYENKLYHFFVNGRTGRTTGDRPYSVAKIVLAILAGLAALGAFVWFLAGG
jgi:DNA-directed RNA polymerase subunit RPC12/RpoP